ncbi:hypothetical protein J437_LFUL011789 [Ladona fulva]|uniref:Monocarboxylate transporter n=1 Tax=Ladona fulva TaxID=123851 RepID=A0A8K0P3F6_LADFU|nr:hypothetical protein J437_LFUL011789 [Ladona fulva]
MPSETTVNGKMSAKKAEEGAAKGGGQGAAAQKMIPPDGGWGWVVVFSFAVNYLIAVPMMQSFGLIFKDTFKRNDMSATDSATVLNINSALTFGLGLANGPLLRAYSYRRLAVVGSFLIFIGITATAFAKSLTHIIITYSVITACGFCFSAASFSLALNSFFRKKRSRAMSFAMTAAGLGPVIMPPVISYLLKEYAVQGTVMIMGALTLHSVAASLLLQPVRWHLKPAPPEDPEKKKLKEEKTQEEKGESAHTKMIVPVKRQRTLTTSSVEHDLDSQSIYGFDSPLVNSNYPERDYQRTVSEYTGGHRRHRYSRGISVDSQGLMRWQKSMDTVNLASSWTIFDDRWDYVPVDRDPEKSDNNNTENQKKKHFVKRALEFLTKFFYLELLKDPIYVNIMLGKSVAIFAEVNFSLLTPFILNDFGFTTEEVAMVMSLTAGVDITFRFLVPLVTERFHFHPRSMYLFSLTLLISSRTLLTFFNSISAVMGIASFLGLAKGIRTVYMSLVLPTYVPIEKLAGASGIQMLVNGIIFAALGPLMGTFAKRPKWELRHLHLFYQRNDLSHCSRLDAGEDLLRKCRIQIPPLVTSQLQLRSVVFDAARLFIADFIRRLSIYFSETHN